MNDDTVLSEFDTAYGHYQVVDTTYGGRRARVLYGGDRLSAQSGVALDNQSDLLFDYNQRFYELIIGVQPKNVLIIGGGAFSLPKALMDDCPDLAIDIVEIDEKLPSIASEYFDFHPSEQVRVHIADGLDYCKRTREKYDIILVDAFTHEVTPLPLQTPEAAAVFNDRLSKSGILAMNIIASRHGARSAALHRQIEALQLQFGSAVAYPASHGYSLWLPQNFIVTAQLSGLDLSQYLRYSPLLL